MTTTSHPAPTAIRAQLVADRARIANMVGVALSTYTRSVAYDAGHVVQFDVDAIVDELHATYSVGEVIADMLSGSLVFWRVADQHVTVTKVA